MLVDYIKGDIFLWNQCTCGTQIVNVKHNLILMNVASFFNQTLVFLFYIFIFNRKIQTLEIQLLIKA
jgi:hypothetical protein